MPWILADDFRKLDPNILAPVSLVKTRQQNAVQSTGSPILERAGLSASRTGFADVPHVLRARIMVIVEKSLATKRGSAQPAVEESPGKLLEAVDNDYATTDQCSMWTSWWFGHKVTKGAKRDSCYGAETNEV